MLGFLQFLVAALIVDAAASAPGLPPLPDEGGIAGLVCAFALLWLWAGRVIASQARRDERRGTTLLLAAGNVGRVTALAAFWAIVGPLGGAGIPAALGVRGWVLVPHLVELAPYFVLLAALRWGLHAPAREMGLGPARLRTVLAFEFRQAVLPLAPILVLLALRDLRGLAGETSSIARFESVMDRLPATQTLLGLAAVFAVLLFLPFVLRVVWRARPLPPGPLRDRLEAYSRRVGFRARDILVWPTGGDALNAAVIGAFPRFRYALLTDGLLRALDEEEVEAVFAHEAGHARRGHILLFFGFTGVLAMVGLVPGLGAALGLSLAPLGPFLGPLVLVLVWFGVIFGWVSRRFEQEADVYGVETAAWNAATTPPEAHPFARALERIGHEVGAVREVTGWRHFSIADRVDFVRRYLADEGVRRRYRRSILVLRGTLLAAVVGVTAVAAVRLPGEIRLGLALWESAPEALLLPALRDAVELGDDGRAAVPYYGAGLLAADARRDEDAARWVREAVARGLRDAPVLASYAALLEGSGRRRGAALAWREVAASGRVPEPMRRAAAERAAGLEKE